MFGAASHWLNIYIKKTAWNRDFQLENGDSNDFSATSSIDININQANQANDDDDEKSIIMDKFGTSIIENVLPHPNIPINEPHTPPPQNLSPNIPQATPPYIVDPHAGVKRTVHDMDAQDVLPQMIAPPAWHGQIFLILPMMIWLII